MLTSTSDDDLPKIPVLRMADSDWPVEMLSRELARAHSILDAASALYPSALLRLGDAISRRWLAKSGNPYLSEIDVIARHIGRPGAYYLNVSYEWGCTVAVGPGPEGRTVRLVRVLDWPDQGLGRYVIAARIENQVGPWITLTWPGYTGVLQALAPGRFAAALNQAPMEKPTGLLLLDWLVNRCHVWKRKHLTPAHLLRHVFETAKTYGHARRMLIETPLALPTIYSLAGVSPDEACIIERREDDAHVIEGPACAANDWQAPHWQGRGRGEENAERAVQMSEHSRALYEDFSWLRPPVLNECTRLAMIGDAASGELVAQGFENDGPATCVLRLNEHL